MHPFYAEYLGLVQIQHDELKKAMQGMPAEALDWTPAEGANSLAVLAVHVAGSQVYWLGDVVSGRPSHRDRASEFTTRQLDAPALAARLDAAMDDSTHAFKELTLESLTEPRLSPRNGQEHSLAWVLYYALQHIAQHVGHAHITRQLWDEQQSAR